MTAIVSTPPEPGEIEAAILGDIPPYLARARAAQAVIRAYGNEFERIQAAAEAIRYAMFPTQADDVVLSDLGSTIVARILSMWEALLSLPVAPPGVPIADRRAKVRAHIQKRQSGAGFDWISVLTEGFGTTQWSHEEGPGDYQVTVFVPFASGSYQLTAVAPLVLAVSPAHLEITISAGHGFLAGISLVGIEPVE